MAMLTNTIFVLIIVSAIFIFETLSVMLQSYLVDDNGICLVKENPQLRTNIRIGAVDLDVAGS